MKLSVIIPCFNAADTIQDQLDALSAENWSQPWEVIISDNNSTDESVAITERYRNRLPHLQIVRTSQKQGGAYAINYGVSYAKGESVVFIDADDVIAPGWLKAIGNALSDHECVASRFDLAKLNQLWTQSRMWSAKYQDVLETRFSPHLKFSGSCGFGIRRNLFEQLGGFDESLPVLWDCDLCFRVQLGGVELYFEPSAVVYVRLRDSLGTAFRQSRQWASYNVLMYKRYRDPIRAYPHPWKLYATLWGQLMSKTLRVRNREDFAKCVWAFGWQIGLLQGSLVFGGPPVPM
jgi:glycosyltransferase involved in cell wall biosynthesis